MPDIPQWSVFTKPWQTLESDAAAQLVADLGFSGAEVPVRDTSFVTPRNVSSTLPRMAEVCVRHGIQIISIAGDLTERVFAAAADAHVPLIRIMASVPGVDYRAAVAATRAELERALPLIEQYGVRVGVQPHYGPFVTSTLGVLDLLRDLPHDGVGIVWDAGHDALAGDRPELTLRLARDRLFLVNLKNAVYDRELEGGGKSQWRPSWVPGPDGLSDWGRVLTTLKEIEYSGPICLSAEYSRTSHVGRQAAEDLAYARSLWTEAEASSSASRRPG